MSGYDPYEIRRDFHILTSTDIVYLDNAATSQRPRQVIEAIREFYEKSNANVHRGIHRLSMEASKLYEEAHEKVAKFIGAEMNEVVFVKGTTEALNMAANLLLDHLREGEIVLTRMEHHSNILPWLRIARIAGAKVKVADVDDNGRLLWDNMERAVTEKTRVVAVTLMSNVSSVINDIERISKLAHSVGAIVVVDGAQGVPHLPVNVRSMDIDMLAFSGHKMLGPTGIGVLYIRKDLAEELEPAFPGGGAIKAVSYTGKDFKIVWEDPPWKFEAGTPPIAQAIGLAEAVEYLERIGMENIYRHEVELIGYFFKRLKEEGLEDKLRILGPKSLEKRGGIVSFVLGKQDPHVTAYMLDKHKIAVRSGFHCAQPLHERLGFNRGSVRASVYLYNVKEDIEKLITALKTIANSA